jgi:hypothetical protein
MVSTKTTFDEFLEKKGYMYSGIQWFMGALIQHTHFLSVSPT